MSETEFEQFSALLDDVLGLYPPRPVPVTVRHRAMFFRAVAPYSLGQVQGAFDGHVKDPVRGRFPPLPADVIAQLESAAADDGRPGAEEAWAIASRAANEATTVVWTAEIAQAYGIALPVLNGGDEVGARMAFRESYTRLVGEARRARCLVAWSPSLGHDARSRDAAIAEAVEIGRLSRAEYPQLAAPAGDVPLLELAEQPGAPPEIQQKLEQARKKLTRMPDSSDQVDHGQKEWAWRLKAREESGEKLTKFQRDCWREALASRAVESVGERVQFTPPPTESLPRGMRPAPVGRAVPYDVHAEYAALAGAPA